MKRRTTLAAVAALAAVLGFGHPASASAQAAKAPDELIRAVSNDVLDAVKADAAIQSGDVQRIMGVRK